MDTQLIVANDDDDEAVRLRPKPFILTDLGHIPGERRVSIFAVKAGQCRWPVADDPNVIGGICCCGAPTAEVYCTAHRKLASPDPPRASKPGRDISQAWRGSLPRE